MPFNITPELVRQLMEQNAALLKQNEELTATIMDGTYPDHQGTAGTVEQKLQEQFQAAFK